MTRSAICVCNLKNRASVPQGFSFVRVDRKTALGNPFPMENESQREHVIERFRHHLDRARRSRSPLWGEVIKLAERVRQGEKLALMCWCAPNHCHGHVIKSAIEAVLNNKA